MENNLNLEELATRALSKLLDSLNYDFSLSCSEFKDGVAIMISCPEAKFIIGDNGDRLDDLQYLVNRAVQKEWPEAPRVRIDCDEYRARSEDKIIARARSRAERVLESGVPLRMEPLNAYQRRLVHNALAEIDGIATQSEESESRFKSITISLKD